jgi:6-phosphogluconolactonase
MRFDEPMRTIRQLSVFSVALAAPLLWPVGAAGAAKAAKGEYLVYIGAYTGKKSQGIQVLRFSSVTGKLTPVGLAAETPSPSWVTIHPNHRFLYAVSEISNYEGKRSGAVAAFRIDATTGQLTFLNKVASRGAGPCFVTVDKTGKCVLVANYGGGSVAVLPIKEDGSLSEASAFVQHSGTVANPKRQGGPHAHSINVSPNNRFAIVADLGLDEVLVYRFDPVKGSLVPNEPPFTKVSPVSGPRHFAFHPNGKFGYVINEIASTVTAFSYDAAGGVLKELQTIRTLPEDFKGVNNTAEVQVHPSGKFLYGSNRGHDSIAVFAVDSKKGTLQAIEQVSTQGKVPRNFGIDPTGSYLIAANQNSDNLVVFRIDRKTGKLTPTGQTVEVGAPVCVKFLAVK